MRKRLLLAALAILALPLVWCGMDAPPPLRRAPAAEAAWTQAPSPSSAKDEVVLEPSPQRPGDAQRGYKTLVNGEYMTCGVPWSLYRDAFGTVRSRVPGRTGLNRKLPLELSAATNGEGVTVVSPNCLGCHAAQLRGETILGLGSPNVDMTMDVAWMAWAAGLVLPPGPERRAWSTWYERVRATSPYVVADTVGVHTADNLAVALSAHRDPKTLAWRSRPHTRVPPQVLPVDVPAWWLLKKKAAMFHTGIGRGDQARIMMSSSLYCTDTVEEARRIDAAFPDVRAYLLTLKPPAYPLKVDRALVRAGRAVFEDHCAHCHGTYGETESYPNKVISVREVGTDPLLSRGSQADVMPLIGWFNDSFYGERARLEPTIGYVAPPLDGIWATAPYFHNGSVPTLDGVLDSSMRPRFFIRSFDGDDYDPSLPGWPYEALSHGKAAEPDAARRRRLYDTTRPGYSNQGHTYGDDLSGEQRTAVLEYLKTL